MLRGTLRVTHVATMLTQRHVFPVRLRPNVFSEASVIRYRSCRSARLTVTPVNMLISQVFMVDATPDFGRQLWALQHSGTRGDQVMGWNR